MFVKQWSVWLAVNPCLYSDTVSSQTNKAFPPSRLPSSEPYLHALTPAPLWPSGRPPQQLSSTGSQLGFHQHQCVVKQSLTLLLHQDDSTQSDGGHNMSNMQYWSFSSHAVRKSISTILAAGRGLISVPPWTLFSTADQSQCVEIPVQVK